MNNGREKVAWSQEIWDRIDQAVHAECQRTKIAAKFLPMYGPIDPKATTVPSDTVLADTVGAERELSILSVDETATTPIVEIQVQFQLTPQQVHDEAETDDRGYARDASGQSAFPGRGPVDFSRPSALENPLFQENRVQLKSGRPGVGLVNLATLAIQTVQVRSLPPRPDDTQTRWGENSFAAVASAYSILQSGDGLAQAHYGPYALVFQDVPYADTYAPLPQP